jgi:hypothetical protein
MMRYWNFGNSDNFLLLLSNVAEADRCCHIVNDRKETDEDELASAQEFLQESTDNGPVSKGHERGTRLCRLWER